MMRLARPGFAARSVLRLPIRRALHRLGDPPSGKPVFYDMAHSNNAARIRLWRLLKEGMTEELDRCVVAYPDLKTPAFKVLNPLQKVPALVHADGTTVFESNVILDYLDDKYGAHAPSFKPPTAEGRQLMNLFIRIHDLYIASPNCCAPGFSHCQGAMYLSNGWHGAARGMDLPTREAKIGEIWRQLNWLEAEVTRVHADAGGPGPYMLGEQLTLADLTWFPTCVFMEYMLPRVFGWAPPFAVGEGTPFPALAAWYTHVREAHAEFERTHADIWGYWEELDGQGQFQCIVDEIRAAEEAGEGPYKRTYGMPQRVALNYQEPPAAGKRNGRYINRPDEGDVEDLHLARQVRMHDGRELVPEATLERKGFELRSWPTALAEVDLRDEAKVAASYYPEVEALLREATGAQRVIIFDHTIRETGNTNLNAAAGGSAAPVPRVHCDYTAEGAPRRLRQFGQEGKLLTEAEVAALGSGRFAFINVWRSICDAHPVLQQPLAVCDEASVGDSERFKYELIFPDRIGENYSLRHSDGHMWYYYPRMGKDECLMFKVYDKEEGRGPRFVFHTAFDDPASPRDPPPRKSIEARAIVFY